ncbi:MAG: hypothetical protein ACRDVL_00290 [Acidimicrobiia bacterium]
MSQPDQKSCMSFGQFRRSDPKDEHVSSQVPVDLKLTAISVIFPLAQPAQWKSW